MNANPNCPICGDPLEGPALVECSACHTPHHRDCFRYNGACAIYSCGSEKFSAFKPAAASATLRLTDTVAIGFRPPPPAAPAARADTIHTVVLDFESPTERWLPWLAVTGLAVATWSAALGMGAGMPRAMGAWGLFAGSLACLAGCILWYGLEDVHVFNPTTGTLQSLRQFYNGTTVRDVLPFGSLSGVSVQSRLKKTLGGGWSVPDFWQYWLVLHLQDGSTLRACSPMGGPGYDASADIRRVARRVAETTGAPLLDDARPRVVDAPSLSVPRSALLLLWFLGIGVAGFMTFGPAAPPAHRFPYVQYSAPRARPLPLAPNRARLNGEPMGR